MEVKRGFPLGLNCLKLWVLILTAHAIGIKVKACVCIQTDSQIFMATASFQGALSLTIDATIASSLL